MVAGAALTMTVIIIGAIAVLFASGAVGKLTGSEGLFAFINSNISPYVTVFVFIAALLIISHFATKSRK